MKQHQELSYWLTLCRCPKLGPRGIIHLLKSVPTITDLFEQDEDFYLNLGLKPHIAHYLRHPNWREIEKDLKWLDQNDQHHILTLACEAYPDRLLNIPDPPPVLFVKGELELLDQEQIAVVGSRKSSPEGKEIAFELAKELGQAGMIVTSGLAIGIDASAHLGALETSKTIAVIGTGINITYPLSNSALAEKISSQGTIVSEMSLDTPPLADHFPRRNRIISGLSLGTLVVEADLQSGSLITARFAAEQGREVFAVPGHIRNPKSKGCHQLIKSGAKLTENVADILEEFGYASAQPLKRDIPSPRAQFKLEDAHLKLLECVGYEPAKIDILVARSKFSVQVVSCVLMDLELAGYVSSSINGYRRVS